MTTKRAVRLGLVGLLLVASGTFGQICPVGSYAWVPESTAMPGVLTRIKAAPDFDICESLTLGRSPEGAVLSPSRCDLYVLNELDLRSPS